MIEHREIFGYKLKGTTAQLDELEDLLNCEDYTLKRFTKYFYVWVCEGYGVFWFPKEKYYGGEQQYALALLRYGALNRDLLHESVYAGTQRG